MGLGNLLSSIPLITSLASLAVAAPGLSILGSRDVSASLLSELSLFAQYSAAAYCSININSTGTPISCFADICPEVEAASVTTLYEFDETSDFGDVAGFLAVDDTNELIVLAFRGSSNIENWVANLDLLQGISSLCENCSVHKGFWKAWETVADVLTLEVKAAIAKYPDYRLVITGHSLGAALAILSGTALQNEGLTLDVYNYGQPRVGNLAMAEYLTKQGNLWRVTHSDDPVPRIPVLLGYHHSSPEYWIKTLNNVTVTASNISFVEGIGSTAGNSGQLEIDVKAHNWYFVDIDGCS